MNRPLFCVVVACAVAAATSGCGFGLNGATPVPSEPSGVVRGGTLRIGITRPVAVDPAQAYDRAGQLIVSAMCDPLLEVKPDTGELYAGLTTHIVPESDGGGITITLKKGLRFSDGGPVVVKDVRASLSRVASDTLASPLALELKQILGFPFVHGDLPVKHEDDPIRTTLGGAVQVTKQVVTLGLSAPDAEFGARLSRPWSAVTPSRVSDRSDFGKRPVCVGPYRLAKDWSTADTEITLVRSKSYFARNEVYTGGGRGYPDSLVFTVYPTEEAAFAGYLKGEVDVARVPRSKLGTAVADGRIVTASTPAQEYVGLPTTLTPYDKPDVRAALSMALDRNRLIAQLGRKDRLVATGMVPDLVPGGLTDSRFCREVVPAAGDVAGARALLTKAGVSLKGRVLPFYFNDEKGSGNKELMTAVGAQWAAAFGLQPKLVPMSWQEFRTKGANDQGFDGAFRTSWSSSSPAPGSWLQPLFLGQSIGSTNLAHYSAPYLDKYYKRLVFKQNDEKVRHSFEVEVAGELCAAAPIVPVWTGTSSYVVRNTVGTAATYQRPLTGELNIRELYVRH